MINYDDKNEVKKETVKLIREWLLDCNGAIEVFSKRLPHTGLLIDCMSAVKHDKQLLVKRKCFIELNKYLEKELMDCFGTIPGKKISIKTIPEMMILGNKHDESIMDETNQLYHLTRSLIDNNDFDFEGIKL